MDDIYGLFHEDVGKLSIEDKKMKESWIDEVGKTYHEMNDNIYEYCKLINGNYVSTVKHFEMIKNNYDEDEINSETNRLVYLANEVL